MRVLPCWLFGLVCLLLPGCGPSDAVWVTLDLQKGGKPYVAPENQSVQVTLYGWAQDACSRREFERQPYTARLTGEAKYEVPGLEGYGVPAGKYRIAIIQKPRSGTLKPAAAKGRRPPCPTAMRTS